VLNGVRRTVRLNVVACVATAEVEQAEEVEVSEAPAAPAAAVENGQSREIGEDRRRTRPPQSRRRPSRKDVIYNIADLVVGQEVEATVVRLCFSTEELAVTQCFTSDQQTFEQGHIYGQVGVTTYGAFVDYGGGKDALIHISQLTVKSTLLKRSGIASGKYLLTACMEGILNCNAS